MILMLIPFMLCAELRVRCLNRTFLITPNVKKTAASIEDEFRYIVRGKSLVLEMEGSRFSIPYEDFIGMKRRNLEERIMEIRKIQNSWDKLNFTLFNKKKVYDLETEFRIDEELVRNRVEELNQMHARSGVDAKISDFKGFERITREENATRINLQEVMDNIHRHFESLEFLTKPELHLKLRMIEIVPLFSFAGLSREQGLIFESASIETHADPQDESRMNNLLLALRDIDGVIIKPRQTVSYNHLLGARTKSRGYLDANGIVGGKLVPSVGGGICQVSSSLYGPVLLSGMDIIEQHNHSLRGPGLDYVPAGEDAAVVYPDKDFSFRNPFPDRRFLISARMVNDTTVSIKIFTDKPLTFSYRLDKKEKQSGKNLSVKLFRLKCNGDEVIEREFITDNYYKLFD